MKKQLKKIISFWIILTFFVIASAAGEQSPDYFTPKLGYKSGEILVKFKSSVSSSSIDSIHRQINASLKKKFENPGVEVITLNPETNINQAIKYYQANPDVEYVEPNYIININSTMPNDPSLNKLWGLHNTGQTGGVSGVDMDAPEAWDIFKGDSEVIVGVIDTGVDYNHADLNSNMWVNTAEANGTGGVDDDGNGYVDDIYGWNAVTNTGNPMDDHGHGTHVAGTIGAVGNNGIGVAGVNWNVKIMALKFLASGGSGYLTDALECFNYVVKMKERGVNIRVTNNSWGGGGYSQALFDGINAMKNANILFVAAAGNSSSNNDSYPAYPASYNLDNIISVAAIDSGGGLAYFSNYGAVSVDVGAPGVGIYSTVPTGACFLCDASGYKSLNGTSMASPHVAGLAALVWGYSPDLNYTEVRDIILTTVDPLSSLSGKTASGGKVNAFTAIKQINPLPVIDTISPAQGPTGITVSLKGKRLGTETGTISFSPGLEAAVKYWSDTLIICVVPDTANSGEVTITKPNGDKAVSYYAVGSFINLRAFMPVAVARPAVAALNDKIYVLGGFATENLVETGAVQIYDFTQNFWIEGSSKPTPAANAPAVVIDNKIYMAGGFQSSNSTRLNKLEVYDPLTDTWETGTSLPIALSGAGAVSLDGKLYVTGGYFSATEISSSLFSYDPFTSLWTTLAPMSVARAYHAMEVIGEKIYVFGGYGTGGIYLSSVEVYDPSLKSWKTLSSMKTGRFDFAGVAVNGSLYAVGGNSKSLWDPPYLVDMEVYDPGTDSWSANNSIINKGRQGLRGVSIGTNFFVLGGFNGTVSDVNETTGWSSNYNPVYIKEFSASPSSGIVPVSTTFSVTALGGAGEYTYSWDFNNDGSEDNSTKNPSHTFSEIGVYPVTVKIVDAGDRNNFTTGELMINVVPEPPPYSPVGISSLSVNPAGGVAPLTATFNVIATGGSSEAYTFAWDFGDGGTSNSQNPSHLFQKAGTYAVKVVISDAKDPANSNPGQLNVIVVDKPVFYSPVGINNLSASPSSGVAPLNIYFSVSATGGSGSYTYAWDFDNNGVQDSLQQYPSYLYTLNGTYKAVVTVTDKNDATNKTTGEIIIKVAEKPPVYNPVGISYFSVNPSTGVVPLAATFFIIPTGGSTGNYLYAWDFGDGLTDNIQNPSHKFDKVGTFLVSVVVTDVNDPANSATGQLKVITVENPVPYSPVGITNLSSSPSSGYAPLSTVFNLSVVGGSGNYTYSWDFDNNGVEDSSLKNPTNIFTAAGTYTSRITVADAADATNKVNGEVIIRVIDKPADYSPVVINNLSVNPASGVVPINTSFNVLVSGGSGEYGYLWDFGDTTTSPDQNPSHNYNKAATYKVRVTVTDKNDPAKYGTGNLTVIALEKPLPYVPVGISNLSASPMSGLIPLDSYFNITATGGSGNFKYLWSFGDGTTSSLQNPTHTYAVNGSYIVTITVTDSNDSRNTSTGQLTVMALKKTTIASPVLIPYLSVSPINGVAPLSVTYGVTATGGAGAYNYLWNFGDGQTSTLKNPSHTYLTVGKFPITVTVTDAGNANNSITGKISVTTMEKPNTFSPVGIGSLSASPMTGVAPLNVNFKTVVSGGSGNYKFSWDFGDGKTSAEQSPLNIYSSVGTYNVRVTITDANDLNNTTSGNLSIIVVETPVPYSPVKITYLTSTPMSGVAPLNSTFAITASGGSGNYQYLWKFGDGTESILKNPAHIYQTTGKYVLTVTVTDTEDKNNVAAGELTVTAVEQPVDYSPVLIGTLSASPLTGIAPLDVAFKVNVSGASGKYVYAWDFGDGKTSALQNPNNNFEMGTYNVKVVITDLNDKTNTAIGNLKIFVAEKPAPFKAVTIGNLSASPMTGLAPLDVTFNLAASGGSGTFNYAWDFGDGSTSKSQNPIHKFYQVGKYPVVVTVVDTKNPVNFTTGQLEVVTLMKPVSYLPLGISSLNAASPTGNVPLYSNFSVTVSGGSGNYLYAWDFGDGGTSAYQSPSHTFFAAGTYTVKVTITDGNDLTNTISGKVTVIALVPLAIENPLNISSLSAYPATGTAPLNVYFGVISKGGSGQGIDYLWEFGDQGVSTQQYPQHLFSNEGIYLVKVTVTDKQNAGNKVSGVVKVVASKGTTGVTPVGISSLTATPVSGTVPLNVTFTITPGGGSGVYKYAWDFGNGLTSTLKNPSHTYQTVGDYAVKVTVSDAGDANNFTSGQLSVRGYKVPPTVLPVGITSLQVTPSSGTAPLYSTFKVTADGGSGNFNYAWDFGDGASDIQQNPAHVFQTAGTYKVKLKVTDGTNLLNLTNGELTVVVMQDSGASDLILATENLSIFSPLTNVDVKVLSESFVQGNVLALDEKGIPLAETKINGNDPSLMPKLIALVSATPKSGLIPLSVSLNVNVTGGSGKYLYHWEFGDGKSSDLPNPQYLYSTPGVYQATVLVTDSTDNRLQAEQGVIIRVGVKNINLDTESPGSENRIDGYDVIKFGLGFGANSESEDWDAGSDLNKDGVVDGTDLSLLSVGFGKNI